MTIDRSIIRVKAMLIAPNADRTAHAVSLNRPTAEHPGGHHRLIGGSVELGETHREAIVREVDEELGARIEGLTYLGAVENIFRIDGVLGHEVVFLYSGQLDPSPPAQDAFLTECDGSIVPVVWRSLTGEEALPLFPAGAEAWLDPVTQQPTD